MSKIRNLVITVFALLVRFYEAGECENVCFGLTVSSGEAPTTHYYTYTHTAGLATFATFSHNSWVCSNDVISYSSSISSSSGASTSFISVSGRAVSWHTSSVQAASTYTITLTGTVTIPCLGSNTDYTASTSFTLVASPPPCSVTPETISFASSSISAQSYTLSFAGQNVVISDFTENSFSCVPSDIVYSMSVSPTTTFITLSGQTVSWVTDYVMQSTTYTVTVTGTINAQTTQSHSMSFTITTSYPPCSQTPETINFGVPTITDRIYEYYELMGYEWVTQFTEDSFSCSTSDIVYTMQVSSQQLGQDTTFIMFDASIRLINWYLAEVRSLTSQFTVTITGTIAAITNQVGTTSFSITTTVPTCIMSQEQITLTQYTTATQNYDYTLPGGFVVVTEFTENSVACATSDIVYSMTVSSSDSSVDWASYISFDAATRTVSWYWNFVPNASTFTITIEGKITTYTNSQGALTDTSPRDLAYLRHRLWGYQTQTNEEPNLVNYNSDYTWTTSESNAQGTYSLPNDLEISLVNDANAVSTYLFPDVTYSNGATADGTPIKLLNSMFNTVDYIVINQFDLVAIHPECYETRETITVEESSLVAQDFIIGADSSVDQGTYQFEQFRESTSVVCLPSHVWYTYTVEAVTPKQSYLFISFDANTRTFTWPTEDKLNEGIFIITVTGQITSTFYDPNPFQYTAFTLQMKNICNVETTLLTGYLPQNTFDYPAGNPQIVQKLTFGDSEGDQCYADWWTYTMFNEASNDQISLDFVDNMLGISISFDSTAVEFKFQSEFSTVPQTVMLRLDVTRSDGSQLVSIYYQVNILESSDLFSTLNGESIPTEQEKETIVVPCLTSNEALDWLYEIPEADLSVSDEFIFGNDGSDIYKVLIFDQVNREFRLDVNSSHPLPENNQYNSTYTLTTENNFQLNFTFSYEVKCDITTTNQSYENQQDDTNVDSYSTVEENGKFIRKDKIPVPNLSLVSNKGKVQILWSVPMQIELQNGESQQSNFTRQLDWNSDTRVQYIQNSNPDYIRPESLSFKTRMFWVDSMTYEIQFEFENPELVSADSRSKDIIIFSFNPSQFKSQQNIKVDTKRSSVVVSLPKQYPKEAIIIDTLMISNTSRNASRFVLILNIFQQAIASYILSYIEGLATIINMFILTLGYPAHVLDFFASFFPLITFDVVPTDDLYDKYLGFSAVEETSITDQFDSVGYGATLMIRNMGSLFLLLLINPITFLTAKLIRSVVRAKDWSCLNRKFIRPWAVENSNINKFLQFFDANYLVLSIMSLINLQHIQLTSEYILVERFNSAFAIIWFSLQLIYPFAMCLVYRITLKRMRPFPDLKEHDGKHVTVLLKVYKSNDIDWIRDHAYTKSKHQKLMDSYGYLLQDLDLKRISKRLALATVFIRILQKFIIAVSIMVFLDYPYFTIFSFVQTTMFYTIFMVWNHPYSDPAKNRQVIIDQITTMIVVYHVFCFTEWTDFTQKTIAGNSLIFIFGGQLIFFIFQICLIIAKNVLGKRRLRRIQLFFKKMKKQRRLIQQAREAYNKKLQNIQVIEPEKKERRRHTDNKPLPLAVSNQIQIISQSLNQSTLLNCSSNTSIQTPNPNVTSSAIKPNELNNSQRNEQKGQNIKPVNQSQLVFTDSRTSNNQASQVHRNKRRKVPEPTEIAQPHQIESISAQIEKLTQELDEIKS